MFSSAILRSALSVSSNAARQSARQTVRVNVPTSALSQYTKLYGSRITTVAQWGVLLGTVMFWPQGAAEIVKVVGVNNV